MIRDIEFLNTNSLQAEVDTSSTESEEEQQRKIMYNIDLMESIRKLNEHDFIKWDYKKIP